MKTIHLEKAGDFYEAYNEDAKDMASALEITLTKRRNMPMAGIPAHAVASYIDTLNTKGFNVKFNRKI